MSNWKFTTYTQRGINHSVCQDRVKIYEDKHRLIACLCDGLGSLNNSHIAAEVTVNTVIETFRELSAAKSGDKQIKSTLVDKIQSRLQETADEKGISPVSMDCTLLFVCLFKQQDIAVIGNLGDSALCMIGKSDVRLYCENSIHSDGTRAVQDEDAEQHLNMKTVKLRDSVQGFLLTSDGLENEIYFKGLDYVSKGAELYFNAVLAEDPKSVIADRVKSLTADPDTIFYDDISVAVLSRAEAPVCLPEEPTWPCVCGNNNPLYESFCTKCGRDFLDVYRNVDLKGDKTHFFRRLQRDPEKREQLLESLCDTDAATENLSFMSGIPSAAPSPYAPPAPQQPGYGYAAPAQQRPMKQQSFAAPAPQNSGRPAHAGQPRQQAKQSRSGSTIPVIAWAFMVGGLAVGLLLGAVLMALVKDASNAPPRTGTRITQPVPGNENGGAPGGNIGAENSGDNIGQNGENPGEPPSDPGQQGTPPAESPSEPYIETTISPNDPIIGKWECNYNGTTYTCSFTENRVDIKDGVGYEDSGTFTREGSNYVISLSSNEKETIPIQLENSGTTLTFRITLKPYNGDEESFTFTKEPSNGDSQSESSENGYYPEG